jgi:outer membrane protein TolC
VQHRTELVLSREQIDAAGLQVKTAANQLRPRLDLSVQSGYTGLKLGTRPYQLFTSAGSRVQGADIQGSLTYTFDPSNKTAKGGLADAQITTKRAQEADSATRRKIGSEVITALGELQASRAALVQTRLAERELRQTRNDAQDRLNAAEGVLGDLLSAEDALGAAELATVQAQTRYALAVARLRYATGTLLGADTDHPSIERTNLVTPPLE